MKSLLSWLGNILPFGCGLAGGQIGLEAPTPYPKEEQYITNASPARRDEFRAGRRFGREALAQTGTQAMEILIGEYGEPVWPLGQVGSITHAERYVIASVAPSLRLLGLGLDLELATPLDPKLSAVICGPGELRAGREPCEKGVVFGKRAVVAKEAYFKATSSWVRRRFDFLDVAVTFDPYSGSFEVIAVERGLGLALPHPSRVSGRYHQADGLIAATVWISANPTDRGAG